MSQQNYTWNADEYARHSAGQFKWARELIDKLNLKGDESLLDIGCGDGKITAILADRLTRGKALGIDSSPDMIALAQKNFSAPNLDFAIQDVRTMTFDQRFDLAFSNAALHWIKDHRSMLKRVRHSLKKGGRLLFQMGGVGNAADILDTLDRIMARDKWRPYFDNFPCPYSFYGVEDYIPWLEEAGLEAGRLELLPKDLQHQGPEGLAGWIRTTWLPYLEKTPPETTEDFIGELIETYLSEHPADPDGLVHVKMVRLEVEARRKE